MRDSARALVRLAVEGASLYVCGAVVSGLTMLALRGSSFALAANAGATACTAVWLGYVCWRERGIWHWGKPSPFHSALMLAGPIVALAIGRGEAGLTIVATTAPMILRPSESIALAVVVLGPFGEEIFWRGFVLRRLAAITGLWPALLISSLLFGVAHLGDPVSPIGAAAAGAFLGWVYSPAGTGYLVSAMVYHVLFNLSARLPTY